MVHRVFKWGPRVREIKRWLRLAHLNGMGVSIKHFWRIYTFCRNRVSFFVIFQQFVYDRLSIVSPAYRIVSSYHPPNLFCAIDSYM